MTPPLDYSNRVAPRTLWGRIARWTAISIVAGAAIFAGKRGVSHLRARLETLALLDQCLAYQTPSVPLSVKIGSYPPNNVPSELTRLAISEELDIDETYNYLLFLGRRKIAHHGEVLVSIRTNLCTLGEDRSTMTAVIIEIFRPGSVVRRSELLHRKEVALPLHLSIDRPSDAEVGFAAAGRAIDDEKVTLSMLGGGRYVLRIECDDSRQIRVVCEREAAK